MSEDCVYVYQGRELRGEQIIQSFEENHQQAEKKLDAIEYLSGEVLKREDQQIFIGVKDKLRVGLSEHVYSDCLVITCNEMRGKKSVVKIVHKPIAQERADLKKFLETTKKDLKGE